MNTLSLGKKVLIACVSCSLFILLFALFFYMSIGALSQVGNAEQLAESVQAIQVHLLLSSLVGVGLIVILGFFVGRGSVAMLNAIGSQAARAADGVQATARELEKSISLLADGTSGQASSLEVTSSSLEELSTLTNQNADNTKEANSIMTSAKEAFSEADDSIKKLTTSMSGIASASSETQKIVKTIDEIAFQTNLLALNAAVEAARAGEAGAGFAVVADEVRNLAMRAAEAAKETSSLIDSTVTRVHDGAKLVDETSELFYMAARASDRVGSLMTEIATASEEQAVGIRQVSDATVNMDRVVGGLAESADQASLSSQQLAEQIGAMRRVVQSIVALAGGEAKRPSGAVGSIQSPRKRSVAVVGSKPKSVSAKQLPPAPAAKKTPPVASKAEEIIPFDDDDFEDF